MRAEPQDPWNTKFKPAKWATAYSLPVPFGVCAVARFARLSFTIVVDLGFRSAPPQALRYRHAPRANFIHDLRSHKFSGLTACWCTQTKLWCRPVDHHFEDTRWESFEADLLVGLSGGTSIRFCRPLPLGILLRAFAASTRRAARDRLGAVTRPSGRAPNG